MPRMHVPPPMAQRFCGRLLMESMVSRRSTQTRQTRIAIPSALRKGKYESRQYGKSSQSGASQFVLSMRSLLSLILIIKWHFLSLFSLNHSRLPTQTRRTRALRSRNTRARASKTEGRGNTVSQDDCIDRITLLICFLTTLTRASQRHFFADASPVLDRGNVSASEWTHPCHARSLTHGEVFVKPADNLAVEPRPKSTDNRQVHSGNGHTFYLSRKPHLQRI